MNNQTWEVNGEVCECYKASFLVCNNVAKKLFVNFPSHVWVVL
jgi:hypothetical protein